MAIDSKSTFKITRLIVLGLITMLLLVVGCEKFTEPSDMVRLKELELERQADSLRWHGRLRELELEAEIKKELIKKGEDVSTSLNFGY
jgi:hypothetical protein